VATISDLPEELLVRTVEHLAYPTAIDIYTSDDRERASYADDFAEIRSVCAVSKLFHRIAWPILYTALPPALGPYFAGRSRGALYLRTLVSRPEYRGLLRYIAIDLRLPRQKTRQKQNLGFSDRERIESAMRREVVGLYSDLESGREESLFMIEQRVESSDDESITALILLLCPNITRLDVYTDRSRGFKVELLTEMLEIGAAIRRTDVRKAGVLGSIRPRILEKVRAAKAHDMRWRLERFFCHERAESTGSRGIVH
jgi:hypothetical protein